MADYTGQKVGNYHLVRLLGRGGFADVYLGEHLYLKRQMAIKLLHINVGTKERESFLREAQHLLDLVHPHIVRIFDFAVEGEVPFLVMEYAPGGTLRTRHPKGSQLPLEAIIPYVKQVADALQYVHTQKLIHRDIKPENMLLGEQQNVLLSDFGIAALAHTTGSLMLEGTAGTAPYMAPEQIRGQPRPASDQYALGIVTYEWVCGDYPFHGSALEIAFQHLHTPPPPLHEKISTISPELENVVLTALAKDPRQRFATVKDFAAALEQAAQRSGPSSQIPSNESTSHPVEIIPPSSLSAQPIVGVLPPQHTFLPSPTSPSFQDSIPSPVPPSEDRQHRSTLQRALPLSSPNITQHRSGFPRKKVALSLLLIVVLLGGIGITFFPVFPGWISFIGAPPAATLPPVRSPISIVTPHPIKGGPCTLDTTVTHPQQSKSSVSGLYVSTLNELNKNLLYRYDSGTQQVVWSKSFCKQFESLGTVEQNGVLYLAGIDLTYESQPDRGSVSYLYALNEMDGSVIWGVQIPAKVVAFDKSSPSNGSPPLDLGAIETPTIANGVIYVVQRNGIVYAFNAVTGNQLWTFDTERNAWSKGLQALENPSNVQVVNGVAYVSIVDRIFALDGQSGKALWAHSFNDALNINKSPAIANGMLYLTTFVPGSGTHDTYIYALDARTGTQKWVSVKMQGYINGPIAFNGKVYVMSYDGIWYTLNSASGSIEAEKTLANDAQAPVLINNMLYRITNTELSVLHPDGSAQWSVPVTEAYPFIDDVQGGIIYVSGRGSGIYAYSTTDGSLLWHYAGYLPLPNSESLVTIVA